MTLNLINTAGRMLALMMPTPKTIGTHLPNVLCLPVSRRQDTTLTTEAGSVLPALRSFQEAVNGVRCNTYTTLSN